MSEDDICERHTWVSVGVVTRDGTVCRIWECENCPVWTEEQFAPDHERSWNDTWLAER